MRKSKSLATYKKRLWAIFSKYIRLKNADIDGMVECVTCGAFRHYTEIHAGHYHPRTDGLATFFDERNVHPQCPGCNVFRRGNLTRYAIFLRETYGEAILEELDKLRRETRQIKAPEYMELIQTYEKKLSGLADKEGESIIGYRPKDF